MTPRLRSACCQAIPLRAIVIPDRACVVLIIATMDRPAFEAIHEHDGCRWSKAGAKKIGRAKPWRASAAGGRSLALQRSPASTERRVGPRAAGGQHPELRRLQDLI